jgi:hypothetical protein
VGEPTYLIRYGVMGHVGRFRAFPESGAIASRGENVVIQSDRGIELGEIMIRLDDAAPPANGDHHNQSAAQPPELSYVNDQPRVLRLAGPEDLAKARLSEEAKFARFELCRRIVQETDWPGELIDVEPLLDDRVTVLLYIGPRSGDFASLRAQFRSSCPFDVFFEQAGPSLDGDLSEPSAEEHHTGGGCGSCSCGASTGGCGSAALDDAMVAASDEARPSHPVEKSHSGCQSCAISQWMAARGRRN